MTWGNPHPQNVAPYILNIRWWKMKIASHNTPGNWQQLLLGEISPPNVAAGGLIYNIMEFIVGVHMLHLGFIMFTNMMNEKSIITGPIDMETRKIEYSII